jgi:hypothetical protein
MRHAVVVLRPEVPENEPALPPDRFGVSCNQQEPARISSIVALSGAE